MAPSVLMGIITPVGKLERRALLRSVYRASSHPNVTVRFVIGRPKNEDEAILVALEKAAYNDIMELAIDENMDEGKTYHYFQHVARNEPRYDYVMKTDDDVFVNVTNLERSLRPLPREFLYYGYRAGPEEWLGWMSGMGYVLSWDSVAWLVDYQPKTIVGHEDLLMGVWLDEGGRRKNLVRDECLFYQQPNRKGESKMHGYIDETIVVHGIKDDLDWKEALRFFFGSLPAGGKQGPSVPQRSWFS
ncbi:hypothetical protein THASP1DRAFT_12887 [Thamnocephalis sphaerospora]|uniref:Hexosyltransferase n=1 Tax=Thamnocephalis sphaerospora TaxID=78915 RepID=A0A4V1IXA5_9FUNG|nr:hypothetical protein THASP1DRAFT_12887 [Thamnocephalis sphaerospora]|eukprot:RKP10379.1 hypothetical protein THASP1DRAFT_12887 [Thamnocephalis sphaerospora]